MSNTNNTSISPTQFPKTTTSKTRHTVKFYHTKCFEIPRWTVSQYYESYYLLYWKGSYFLEESSGKYGLLIHGGTHFQIVYKPPLTRGTMLARMQDQYALSFRVPKSDIGLELSPIVMVSAVINHANHVT